MTVSRFQAGDVIGYANCAVLLLADPVEVVMRTHEWEAPAVYIYLPSNHDFRRGGTIEGTTFPEFRIHATAKPWSKPLTDEQEVMAAKFLLIGPFK